MRRTEKIFALVWASIVLSAVLILVFRDKPLPNPNFYVWVRILLSFAIAIVGATIPGFLNVEWRAAGFGIRAAGALALFVITFFGTPHVLTPPALPLPEIELARPSKIDFRTELGPERSVGERLAAPLVLTVPMQYISKAEPAHSFVVLREEAEILLTSESRLRFSWRFFVNQNRENVGKWLGVDHDATPTTISAGGTVYHETAFVQDDPRTMSWGRFLEQIENVGGDVLVHVTARGNAQISSEPQQTCRVDLETFRREVSEFHARHPSESIMRATVKCLDSI